MKNFKTNLLAAISAALLVASTSANAEVMSKTRGMIAIQYKDILSLKCEVPAELKGCRVMWRDVGGKFYKAGTVVPADIKGLTIKKKGTKALVSFLSPTGPGKYDKVKFSVWLPKK